jgi:hypothetical protein
VAVVVFHPAYSDIGTRNCCNEFSLPFALRGFEDLLPAVVTIIQLHIDERTLKGS